MAAYRFGRLLAVHLETGEQRVVEVDQETARSYVGGAGLAARLLTDWSDPSVGPLDPQSPLLFLNGPFTGTKVPLSGRHVVAARSPATGRWGEADAGGTFGTMLRRAGWDGLLVTGAAERPVYLLVDEAGAQVRPADDLWGRDTFASADALRGRHGEKAGVACIGPAGETLSALAAVLHDGRHARAAGRCGLGAVMGSKKLKAVVAGGDRPAPIHDPDGLQALLRPEFPEVRRKMRRYTDYGTAGGMIAAAEIADLPVKNWRVGDWRAEAEALSGERLAETILVGRYYCGACIVGCGRVVEVRDGPYATGKVAGPEYEGLAGVGSLLGIANLEAVNWLNDRCNRLGLDVISAGGALGFAYEAAERGLLPRDGVVPTWGDPQAAAALLDQIARREGLGALLADGVRAAAAALGPAAEPLALHVRGLEPAFHDPRAIVGLALGYATSPRGACHRGCAHYAVRAAWPELGLPEPWPRQQAEGVAKVVAVLQDWSGLFNSLKLCQFMLSSVQASTVLAWLNATTGWGMDLPELLRAGERAFVLKRLYNLARGDRGAADDTLPARFLAEPFADGSSAGFVPPLAELLADYYAYRGWDERGVPTPATLERLGLA